MNIYRYWSKGYICEIIAGLNPEALSGGNVGVFVAASEGETTEHSSLTFVESESDGHKIFGAAGFMIANQISYCFNFQGNSLFVSSGCASSLVALETGVSAIREGRVDAAIVGATCLYLSPRSSIEFRSLGALSPDGICRPFDDSGNEHNWCRVV